MQATTVQTSRSSGAKGCPFVHHQCTCPVRLHPFLFLNPCLLRASSRSPDIVHTLFHYLTCELEHIASITITFKTAIEDNNNTTLTKKIEVHTSNNPVIALSEFKPNFYDLLLVDINMPHMNGFQLCEKILAIDINVRICSKSSGGINRKALREIYPSLSIGCFTRKPMTIDYLIKRVMSELD